MALESSGQWLEKALMELCNKVETGLQLDGEIISGLVSYCEMASPLDAKEYLDEKELLRKKREEVEEAERAKRSKVVMTFDILGPKVLLNDDEASEELQNGIFLRPSKERDEIHIKPNPNLKIQPFFIDPGPRTIKDNTLNKEISHGMCLEISGRVQHDSNELEIM